MSVFVPSQSTLLVSVLVLPGSSIMSVACTLDPMRAANRVAGKTVFEWEILTLDGEPVTLTCGLPVPASGKFGEHVTGEMLIIIAGFDSEIHAGRETYGKLARIARRFTMIGGIEAGSWVMARAGLLTDYRATTHFEDLEDFAARFPKIEVVPDRYVIDGKYFTTGGASPTFDLMLHLVRMRKGEAFAMEVSSVFIYDQSQQSADAQNLLSLGKFSRQEPNIAAAIRLMENHLDEPLSMTIISAKIGISVRSLEMRFYKALQISPGKFYRHLRLQAARRMIVDTNHTLQQVAVRTGFGSSSAFSRAFKGHYGFSPSSIRR